MGVEPQPLTALISPTESMQFLLQECDPMGQRGVFRCEQPELVLEGQVPLVGAGLGPGESERLPIGLAGTLSRSGTNAQIGITFPDLMSYPFYINPDKDNYYGSNSSFG
jgi:hypothetical protein